LKISINFIKILFWENMSKYRNLSLMATVALLFNSKGALAAENLDEVIEGGLELDED